MYNIVIVILLFTVTFMAVQELIMQVITYSDARQNLKSVLDRVIDDADVAVITRKEGQHAVVMGQDYYNSLMETLHLMSSPSNAAHLAKSIAELRASKAIERELLDDETED